MRQLNCKNQELKNRLSNLDLYRVTLVNDSIYFKGSSEMASWIEKSSKPFFRVDNDNTHPVGTWFIGPAQDYDLDDFKSYEVSPAGEPARWLWVNYSMRTICFDYTESVSWCAQECLRIIRDLLKIAWMQNGCGFYHAGLVRVKNRGILLAAPSKSGKTTLALALASKLDAKIVSNDDVSLLETEIGLVGQGWPRALSIRLDSFDAIGSSVYYDYAHLFTHPANKTIMSLKDAGIEKSGTALLYPYEIEKYFNTSFQTHFSVDMILYPHFCQSDHRVIERLSNVESYRRLIDLYIESPAQHREFLMQGVSFNTAVSLESLRNVVSYKLHHAFDDIQWTLDAITEKLSEL